MGIVFALSVAAPVCWAKDAFVADGRFRAVSLQLRSGPSLVSDSPPFFLRRFHEVLSIQTVLIREPSGAGALKDFLVEAQDNRTVGVRMKTSFWSGRISGEGEVAERSTSDVSALQDANALRRRLLRFGLTGALDRFRYGATYRVAGEGFTVLQDQAMREVWGEWTLSVVRLKTAVSERWNNLAKDPRRPRITGVQERASLVLAPRSWPEISLSYGHSSSISSLEPVGILPQRNFVDTLEAALFYRRPRWEARFFSSYWFSSDQLHANQRTTGLAHAVSGLYRLTDALTVTPSLGLREDQQQWSGVRIETPSASLAVAYSPSAMLHLAASGSYSRTHSSDGAIDSSVYRMTSALTWTCCETAKVRTILSFDASYTNALDAGQSFHSTEDISGLLRVQVAGI